MTVGVDDELRIRVYPGDDSATPRAYGFKILDPDDLRVTRTNADGSETVLVRGTHYSVSGAGNPSGGNVTPLAPIATGTSWRIEGDMSLGQPTDYTAGDDFPAESHERGLDRSMIAHQEARRDIEDLRTRAFMLPRGEVAIVLPAADARAGFHLAFDANGDIVMSAGSGADGALRADLADTGDVLTRYNPGGVGSSPTTLRGRLQRDVWVEDYFDGLDPGDDYRIAFDRAMAVAKARGRSRVRAETIIETKTPIVPPPGMLIEGDGKSYRFEGGNIHEGAWIRHRGAAGAYAVRFGSVQDCGLFDIGIDCEGPNFGRHGISIGSDNAPATKYLRFDRFSIFGAHLGVKWGDENATAPLEQCDDITFREGQMHSCIDGFDINATNAADYSLIERMGFDAIQGVVFKLPGSGFMPIRTCAAGLLFAASKMFEISGVGPDAMIIEGCQSEGHHDARFLTLTGTNDERVLDLRNNQINQKIEVTGIHRIHATGNYFNSVVALDGYVRWTGEANAWMGPLETPQVTLANGARFTERVQRDAAGQNGRWIPLGMAIEQIPTAGGFKYQGAMRSGILGFTFVPTAEYGAGSYVLPSADNGYAYKCTIGGVTGAEPAWPTVIGNTVASGAATFQCIGASALMKGMEGIQA